MEYSGGMLPIYVDFDDVLSETGLSIINILKKEYGRDVSMEDLTNFDLKEAFGLTPSEYDHLFELIHRPHEVLAYKPVPGAVETLKTWAGKGHEIAIMTGRFTSAYDASLEWLDRHGVPFDSFTVVDKYQRPGMDMGVAISMARLNTSHLHGQTQYHAFQPGG